LSLKCRPCHQQHPKRLPGWCQSIDVAHHLLGFCDFFPRLAVHEHRTAPCVRIVVASKVNFRGDNYSDTGGRTGLPVAIAMEGFNGHARLLDTQIRMRGYPLYNVNNLKLARFKEIFPGPAKSDPIDAHKILELFQLRAHLLLAKGVLQEAAALPAENDQLKRLTLANQ